MNPFPDRKYSIIYCDPPWEYHVEINSESATFSGGTQCPSNHYPTMSAADLRAMDVASIAEPDCLLFMWATSPVMHEAIALGVAWGFEYKTIGFVWYKQAHTAGFYTMGECEFVLIFKRGRIPQPRGARNIRQFVSWKRGTHSAKPMEVMERIDLMFPTQSKIELFARRRLLAGWDVWGNEVDESSLEAGSDIRLRQRLQALPFDLT